MHLWSILRTLKIADMSWFVVQALPNTTLFYRIISYYSKWSTRWDSSWSWDSKWKDPRLESSFNENYTPRCSKSTVLEKLSSSQVLIIMDWAMKFLPVIFRESQSEWFNKKGKSWHVSAAISKSSEEELVVWIPIKGAVSRNSAKSGYCKMPVKFKET